MAEERVADRHAAAVVRAGLVLRHLASCLDDVAAGRRLVLRRDGVEARAGAERDGRKRRMDVSCASSWLLDLSGLRRTIDGLDRAQRCGGPRARRRSGAPPVRTASMKSSNTRRCGVASATAAGRAGSSCTALPLLPVISMRRGKPGNAAVVASNSAERAVSNSISATAVSSTSIACSRVAVAAADARAPARTARAADRRCGCPGSISTPPPSSAHVPRQRDAGVVLGRPVPLHLPGREQRRAEVAGVERAPSARPTSGISRSWKNTPTFAPARSASSISASIFARRDVERLFDEDVEPAPRPPRSPARRGDPTGCRWRPCPSDAPRNASRSVVGDRAGRLRPAPASSRDSRRERRRPRRRQSRAPRATCVSLIPPAPMMPIRTRTRNQETRLSRFGPLALISILRYHTWSP